MSISLNNANLINTYQQGINYLIDNYGRTVKLFFKPTVSGVNSGFNDFVRNQHTFKPDFKTSSSESAPSVTNNTDTITALVEWAPKDYQRFETEVQKPGAVIRLKTYLTDVPKLKRCEVIIPDDSVHNITEMKFKLLREPVPFGLGISRYAISFWQEV